MYRFALHALEHRIVLRAVQKILRSFGLFQLRSPGVLQAGIGTKRLIAQLSQVRCRELADGKQRVFLTQDARLFPLNLDPGRIPQHQIKAPTPGEHIGKVEFPVQEPRRHGEVFHRLHARKMLAQPADAQLAEAVVQVRAGSGRWPAPSGVPLPAG